MGRTSLLFVAALLLTPLASGESGESWVTTSPLGFAGVLSTGPVEADGNATDAKLVLDISSGVLMEDRREGDAWHAKRVHRWLNRTQVTLVGDANITAPHGLVLSTGGAEVLLLVAPDGRHVSLHARTGLDVTGPAAIRIEEGRITGAQGWTEDAGQWVDRSDFQTPYTVRRALELRVFEGTWRLDLDPDCGEAAGCVADTSLSWPLGPTGLHGTLFVDEGDGPREQGGANMILTLAPVAGDSGATRVQLVRNEAPAGVSADAAIGLAATLVVPAVAWRARRWLANAITALYARVSPQAAKDHPLRAAILREAAASPGASVSEVARTLEANVFTVLYHVEILKRGGHLSLLREGQRVRLFVRGSIDTPDRAAVGLLRNPSARRVLVAIDDDVAPSIRGISRRLEVSASTVAWQVDRLRRAGLLEARSQDGLQVTERARRLLGTGVRG